MKTNTFYYFILLIALSYFLSGCSDDFLKETAWNPETSLYVTVEAPQQKEEIQQISFKIPGAGNNNFSVAIFPLWMKLTEFQGKANDDIITLSYHLDESWTFNYPDCIFGFTIENVGQVEIRTSFEIPYSSIIQIKPTIVDFGKLNTSKLLTFTNQGYQTFFFYISSAPDWIKIDNSQNNGIDPGRVVYFRIECDRTNLQAGTHTGEIVIKEINEREQIRLTVCLEVESFENKDGQSFIPQVWSVQKINIKEEL